MSQLVIQRACQAEVLPTEFKFKSWVNSVLPDDKKDFEVVIRIVDEVESAELNFQYRQKEGATNILSFGFQNPAGMDLKVLGDLIICAPVVEREAILQNKPFNDHWAHMTIHGVLHLLGYDHVTDEDAKVMEAEETRILQHLKIENPYLEKSI